MAKGLPWFRLHTRMLDNPKVGKLSDSAFRLYIELMCLASESEKGDGSTEMDQEEIAWRLRRNVPETLHKELEKADLIVSVKRDETRHETQVKRWKMFQYASDVSTERVRKHRKNKGKITSKDKVKRSRNVLEQTTEQNRDRTEAEQKEKALSGKPDRAGNGEALINEVFSHWQTVMNHPKANLDPKRKALIKAALGWSYSVQDLKDAITGCSYTPHNMGINDRGTPYDGLHIIFKDGGKIDGFIANFESPPRPMSDADHRTLTNQQAGQDFIDMVRDDG